MTPGVNLTTRVSESVECIDPWESEVPGTRVSLTPVSQTWEYPDSEVPGTQEWPQLYIPDLYPGYLRIPGTPRLEQDVLLSSAMPHPLLSPSLLLSTLTLLSSFAHTQCLCQDCSDHTASSGSPRFTGCSFASQLPTPVTMVVPLSPHLFLLL